jgi:hypothetical protein
VRPRFEVCDASTRPLLLYGVFPVARVLCGFRCRRLQATPDAGHGSGSHSRLYPVAAGEGPAAGACGLAAGRRMPWPSSRKEDAVA